MGKTSFCLQASIGIIIACCCNEVPAAILFEDHFSEKEPEQRCVKESHGNFLDLIAALKRITALDLVVNEHYLRLRYTPPSPLLYASILIPTIPEVPPKFQTFSHTARALLMEAIASPVVYRVRENEGARLARVTTASAIELDFADLKKIIFRDLPRQCFDIGMVFLHELVHRHVRLHDPDKDQLKRDPYMRGSTVEYINRIERELRLPERKHYAPVRVKTISKEPRWAIYFGKESDRIELDTSFVIR